VNISTIEPKRQPTKVIIEMTDDQACEIRDFMSPDDLSKLQEPAMVEFLELIHDLTKDW
jgi:hypothetical protein